MRTRSPRARPSQRRPSGPPGSSTTGRMRTRRTRRRAPLCPPPGVERKLTTNRRSAPATKFRNYVPKTRALQDGVLAAPDLDTVEKDAEPLAELDESALPHRQELDMANLAPKKPNWDLKRDVEKRLAKLDRRTNKAIASVLRTFSHFFFWKGG